MSVGQRAIRPVPDNVPRRSWEAFIQHLDHDANVRVSIRGDDQGGVDVRDPKLTQCAVKRR